MTTSNNVLNPIMASWKIPVSSMIFPADFYLQFRGFFSPQKSQEIPRKLIWPSNCFKKPTHCTGAQPSRLFNDSPRSAVDNTDMPNLGAWLLEMRSRLTHWF